MEPDILDELEDLYKQATTERSHNYVASRCKIAIEEIKRLRRAVMALAVFAAGNPPAQTKKAHPDFSE